MPTNPIILRRLLESRIEDRCPRTMDCGGRSGEAAKCSLSMGGRAVSNVSPPTHFIQVDRCASLTVFIQPVEEASFGIDLRTWVRRGTSELVSILCASLEYPTLATSSMKDRRRLCFSSLFWSYCSMKAGDPSGVPRMLNPIGSGPLGAVMWGVEGLV